MIFGALLFLFGGTDGRGGAPGPHYRRSQ